MRQAGAGIATAALALALVWCAPAQAFVSLKSSTAPAGAEETLTFVVEHGCAGSPTVRLRIRMPDGVRTVRPLAPKGWKASAARATASVDAPVAEVVWLDGRLGAETRGEFAMVLRLPDAPGTTLYFPVTQDCEKGAVRWAEIPRQGTRPGNLRFPAPALTLLKHP